MTVLFQQENFDLIQPILDMPIGAPGRDLAAFKTACANTGLEEEEKEWLWNYLEHCFEEDATKTGGWGKTKVRDVMANSSW